MNPSQSAMLAIFVPIFVVTLTWVVWDIVILSLGLREKGWMTISNSIWTASQKRSEISLVVGLSLGLLLGHFFL